MSKKWCNLCQKNTEMTRAPFNWDELTCSCGHVVLEEWRFKEPKKGVL